MTTQDKCINYVKGEKKTFGQTIFSAKVIDCGGLVDSTVSVDTITASKRKLWKLAIMSSSLICCGSNADYASRRPLRTLAVL